MGKMMVVLVAALAASGLAAAERSLKVLMVGNSFSISNTRHMPKVCADLGLELELGSLYIGGCSLERHWKNVLAATNDTFKPYGYRLFRGGARVATAPDKANIPEIVKGTKWDVITLQQASHDSWRKGTYQPFFDNLCAQFKAWCPSAEIVLQETWSYTPFDKRLAQWKITPAEMYVALHRAYRETAAEKHLRTIPMGTAVQLWRERLPVSYAEGSFGGDVCGQKHASGRTDVFHLNARGEYLQALVWTAMLFGADVTKGTYRPACVSAAEEPLMKRVAMAAVAGETPVSPAFGGGTRAKP